MGVDNNGILFLGKTEEELDFSALNDFDMEAFEEDSEYLYEWSDKHGHGGWSSDGLRSQYGNDYHDDPHLIGFILADSGSYGCKKVENLQGLIDDRAEKFIKIFGVHPEIYILNYQW